MSANAAQQRPGSPLPSYNPAQGGARRFVQTIRLFRNEAGFGTYAANEATFKVRHPSTRLHCCIFVGFLPDTAEDATIPAGFDLTLDTWGRTDMQPYQGRYVRGNQIIPGPFALPGALPLSYEAVTGVDEWRGTVVVPDVEDGGTGLAVSGEFVLTAMWEIVAGSTPISDEELKRLFDGCKVEPGLAIGTVFQTTEE